MAGSTKANGETIKCTARAPSCGRTEGSISVNTLMIRSKDTESFCGRMADVTEVNGPMVNRMVKVLTFPVLAKKNMGNGNKERELDGLDEVNNKISENSDL